MKLFLDDRNDNCSEMEPKIEQHRQDVRAETRDPIAEAEIEYKAQHGEAASGVVG
jgi:hypothetical protein